MPNRRQTINWISDDQGIWLHMVSLGNNELTFEVLWISWDLISHSAWRHRLNNGHINHQNSESVRRKRKVVVNTVPVDGARPSAHTVMTAFVSRVYIRVTLYTAGHLHTAVPHCSHSRAPLFTQPCPGRTMSTAVYIYVAGLCASCPAV